MADWFCGVTTAPRKAPTLRRSIDSLRRAGWGSPVVFAEPNSPVPGDVHSVTHDEKLGVWFNWVALARHAVDHGAPWILLVQDDIDLHPESRLVCEAFLRYRSTGPLSLYTCRAYTNREPGIHKLTFRSLWGAVAICWRRSELAKILEHPQIEQWRGPTRHYSKDQLAMRDKSTVTASDVAIGRILQSYGWPMFACTPSLTGHTAGFSSIPGHGGNDVKRNRNASKIADHDRPIAEQLWPEGVPTKYKLSGLFE